MARAGMPAPAGGFVKLPRSVLLGPIGKDPAALALFVHLLAAANIEPKEWEGIRIERGQCVTSRRKLADDTGISEKKVRKRLETLLNAGLVRIETINRAQQRAQDGTIVTILLKDNCEELFGEQGPQKGPARATERAQQRAQQRAHESGDATDKLTTSYGGGFFDRAQQMAHKRAYTKELLKNNRKIIEKELQEKDPELAPIVAEFIDYKQEIGAPYKTPRSIRAAVDLLREMSDGDAAKARAIVQRTIANGWKGLHRLDDDKARKPSTAADRLKIDNSDKFKTTI